MSYNLIGQRFGRLRVAGLAPRGEKYPKQQWWHCVCDCGRTIDLPTGHLTDGKWKSCGCLQSDSRKVDITGERRGSLTAIRPTDKIKHKSRGGSVIWVWRCDCGKEIEAPASSVGPNGRTSCGCMRKTLNEAQAAEMRRRAEPLFVEGTNLARLAIRTPKNNTSGVKGVCWHKRMGKWHATIGFKGVRYSLGYYDRLEDAAAARKAAEDKMFKPMLEDYKQTDDVLFAGEP